MDVDTLLAEIERGAHELQASGLTPSSVELGHAQARLLQGRHRPYLDLPGGLSLAVREIAAEDHLRVVAREWL